MRIDVQTHHMPDGYVKALAERSDYPFFEREGDSWFAQGTTHARLPMAPSILDIGLKIEEMDAHNIDLALISLNIPGPDLAADPKDADELARIGNDGIAEAVAKHPDRFKGFANLGFGDIDATCRELERCIDELGFIALQVFAFIGGKRPLDDPAFAPVWALLAERNVPLVLHPGPSPAGAVYADYWLGPLVGFLFDESIAALRLIFSGIMECHPRLKVLLPHGGATLPLLIGRVDRLSSNRPGPRDNISHAPSHYFERIHTDAVAHSTTALSLALQEMGADRLMFASDAPWVPVEAHVKIVGELGLSEPDADKIWSGTAKKFFEI
ncbi:MAG: amidohydrolase family protein [Nitrospinaceae bacterium]|jgi:aminocarboxymuconate-semialdehyde decarboxylase|nr:amidohydrolase family protein [Nitrospinaceae bacterium]MBT3433918.1 amidohydrolase family protein [Nitrospinaceae bacterium]MBT4095510.1 amidohydrolase family protein [Nitrospinaceae bacterium]MBT4429052.1 amidohydrolase family protein [Nitrospinaceae bacterium]MBT5369917.1 amidohydrolase family protein [Nitrospinaceae bacterium]